jgi:hypothetical protein
MKVLDVEVWIDIMMNKIIGINEKNKRNVEFHGNI